MSDPEQEASESVGRELNTEGTLEVQVDTESNENVQAVTQELEPAENIAVEAKQEEEQLESAGFTDAETESPPLATAEPDQSTTSDQSLTPLGGNVMSIKKIKGIKVNVQVMLGSVSLSVSRLASLKKGELLELDSAIGDPIDILANGHLIARGEIVVLEGEGQKFGITLSEIVDAEIVA